MVYALDTNIVIHFLRNNPDVHQRFNEAVLRGDTFVIPKVVHYEMKRGFRIFQAPKKEEAYKILIGSPGFCDVAEMDVRSWEYAEHVYEVLYRKRLTVGEMDILIAASCIANNHTLITDNVKDFKNIDGLQWENWVE